MPVSLPISSHISTDANMGYADVSLNSDGQFVAVWVGSGPGMSAFDLSDAFMRRFNANGQPIGLQQPIHRTRRAHSGATVSLGDQGQIMLVTDSEPITGGLRVLYGRRTHMSAPSPPKGFSF